MNIQYPGRSHQGWLPKTLLVAACAFSFMLSAAHAQITTVFYILLENRCFTTGTDKSYTNIIYGNAAAPYLNSLCTPGNANAAQVSFCSAYHNDNATTTQTPNSVHPSEPQYVWMEAGSNLSKLDDNDPYGTTNSVTQINTFVTNNPGYTGENLSGLLQNAGISWKCYVEGTNLLNTSSANFNTAGGTLTNNSAPVGSRTVPLVSFSGSSNSYVNEYNGSHEYNFACKHTGALFFPATNGSTVTTANTSTTNVEVSHYGPLEDLTSDLAANTVAQYNVITPDQYNDGHTALTSNFTYANTGQTYAGGSDIARIAQMDNFCWKVVPQIIASANYQAGHTAIVIWTDETEGSPVDDFYHTLTEIVISPYCKGNAYNSTLNYTHSSDVATWQKVFGVVGNTPSGYLNDAVNVSWPTVGTAIVNTGQGLQTATGLPYWGFGTGQAQDLSDLFVPSTVPASLPGLNLTASGYTYNRHTGIYSQTVTVTNALSSAVTNPIYLVVGNLTNTTLSNSAGTTVNNYAGSPYVSVSPSGLPAGGSTTVTLQFTTPTSGGINDTLSVINTSGTP